MTMIIANHNKTMLLRDWERMSICEVSDGFVVAALVRGRAFPVNIFKSLCAEDCYNVIKEIADAIENGSNLYVCPEY
jgi:hypothetical protein